MSAFTDAGNVDLASGQGFALPWPSHRVGVLRRRVDFTVAANQLAQNKLMSLFKVPKDCMILKVGMYVKTAQTNVTTVGLGLYTLAGDKDGAAYSVVADDCFGEGQTLSSTGYPIPPVIATYGPTGSDPNHITAANSVIALVNDDSDTISTAVVDFYAVCMDVSQPIGTTPGGTGSYTT